MSIKPYTKAQILAALGSETDADGVSLLMRARREYNTAKSGGRPDGMYVGGLNGRLYFVPTRSGVVASVSGPDGSDFGECAFNGFPGGAS